MGLELEKNELSQVGLELEKNELSQVGLELEKMSYLRWDLN